MNKQRLITATLILIALSFAAWYVVDHLEWRDETKRSGYSPEARANPWHAGLLLLRRLEHPADKAKSADALKTLPVSSTLMLTGLDRFADLAMRTPLIDWVQRGGHLVLPISVEDSNRELLRELKIDIRGRLQSGGEFIKALPKMADLDFDFVGKHSLWAEGHALQVRLHSGPVFHAGHFAARPGEWQVEMSGKLSQNESQHSIFEPVAEPAPQDEPSSSCADAQADPDSVELAPGDVRSELITPPEAEADASEAPPAAENPGAPEDLETLAIYTRFKLGQGTVTLGDFTPFTNENIQELDHAALFMRLMSLPEGPRPVLMMVVPPYPDLFSWLLERAPEALLVAALLLIASLRRVMPRFGPLLPDAPLARPGLREHLEASGHFLLRQHCFEALLKPLRETVQAQLDALQHRHPEIEGRERLAEHLSKIPTAEVQRALTPEAGNAHEFLRRARTLATLRQRCRLLQRANFPGAES